MFILFIFYKIYCVIFYNLIFFHNIQILIYLNDFFKNIFFKISTVLLYLNVLRFGLCPLYKHRNYQRYKGCSCVCKQYHSTVNMEALVSSVDLEILATFILTVWKAKQPSTHTYIYNLPWPQHRKPIKIQINRWCTRLIKQCISSFTKERQTKCQRYSASPFNWHLSSVTANRHFF